MNSVFSEEDGKKFGSTLDFLDEAARQMKQLYFSLAPGDLATGGLEPALRKLIDPLVARGSLNISAFVVDMHTPAVVNDHNMGQVYWLSKNVVELVASERVPKNLAVTIENKPEGWRLRFEAEGGLEVFNGSDRDGREKNSSYWSDIQQRVKYLKAVIKTEEDANGNIVISIELPGT